MTTTRLSRLQRRILAWLWAEAQRTRGTMAASHRDLVRALGHDKSNLSRSLKGLEAKGLVTIARTPGGQAEAVALTAEGRNRVARLTEVVNKEGDGTIQVLNVRGCGGAWPAGEYVARPMKGQESPKSVLGNPFHIGQHGTRAEVIAQYRQWLREQYQQGGPVLAELERLAAQYRREGHLTLLCWCAPQPCHADVIRDAVLGMCGGGAGPDET